MKVALDLDGTISADPEGFQHLASSLRAKGHKVVVLSGCHHDPITPECKAEKKAYLKELGFKAYDKLKVYPQTSAAQDKGRYCREHNVALAVDNSLRNVQLMPQTTTVLVPWHSISG